MRYVFGAIVFLHGLIHLLGFLKGFDLNEPDALRYEWVLLVDEYKTFEGIKVPSKMTATWKLEKEDWTWLKLEIENIKYNDNALF